MATGNDFDKLCPIFDFNNGGGVIFPFRPTVNAAAKYFDLDGTAGSTGSQAWFKAVAKMRLVSVQMVAVQDANGAKSAAASTEPIIVVRKNPTTSVGTGTLVSTITCDLSGYAGVVWTPGAGTTDTTLNVGDTLVAYLSTAAASATSAKADGGAVPIFWFAAVNAPT